ncbi:MAG: hypothetical protein ACRYFY_06730, partial [Janthinobacterium lividum]
MDVETTIDRGGIAGDQVEGWHMPGSLQPDDHGLSRAHPHSDLSLRQAGSLTGFDHLTDDGEGRPE